MASEDKTDDGSHPVEIGFDYPRFQLAKALRNVSASDGDKARAKVEKWHQVIDGMFSGALSIGSRTPVADTPAWVTLEVVTGGFVTGNMLAGGPLAAHEIDLAGELGIPVGTDTRAVLNGYFLSEDGQTRLCRMIADGRFRIDLPEEGALLIVAWLLRRGDVTAARSILDQLIPLFDHLRFFPAPSDEPTRGGAQVVLQTAGETAAVLRGIAPQAQLSAQDEAIHVWTPLYDRAVALLLETIDGPLPQVERDASGKPARDATGRYRTEGGFPCRLRPAGWDGRAKALLAEYLDMAERHQLCQRWHRARSPFQRFLAAIETVANEAKVSDEEQGYLRMALARYIAKRGTPDSEIHSERRRSQHRQCAGPRYHEIAKILAIRLDAAPPTDGLQDLSVGSQPIGADEANDAVPEGTPVPGHLTRKIGRAQIATVRELIEARYISSADTLAEVLPQMTSEVRASGIADGELRRIYAQVYRAFRRRRSVLLLNLESQVKLEELPWVRALDSYRRDSVSDLDLAKSVLADVVVMALSHFPHAILPNKLLQELRGLARQARLDMPLVDEIAADIFMGRFSAKFTDAARVTGGLMAGTLYERYYGIDFDQVRALPATQRAQAQPDGARMTLWRRLFGQNRRNDAPPETFSALCVRLAGSGSGDNAQWSVAANGTIVEQSQIITTQNLAVLFQALDLETRLGSGLGDLVKSCFMWICHRQQIPLAEYHARLVMLKNTAYAWRQMIFFLSLVDRQEQTDLLDWMAMTLTEQSDAFRTRFRPAFDGLCAAADGKDITSAGGRRFLGWTVGKHWLMPV